MAAVAKALRSSGHPVAALDALASLPAEAKVRAEELKAAEAYLSRRAHDPYQLDRELAVLEKNAALAEVEGDTRALAQSREASDALLARRAEVLSRRDRRDDLLLGMHRLATQSGALLEDLRALDRDGPTGKLLTEGLPGLDRRFAAVVEGLTEARSAEVELEKTLSQTVRRVPE